MIWAEKVHLYRILQRDCRYNDKTFERVGIHYKDRGFVGTYIWNKNKTKLMWKGPIPESILTEKLVCTGTSTYELQEDKNGKSEENSTI